MARLCYLQKIHPISWKSYADIPLKGHRIINPVNVRQNFFLFQDQRTMEKHEFQKELSKDSGLKHTKDQR